MPVSYTHLDVYKRQELNLGGYISLIAYCVIGLVMFLLVGHKTKDGKHEYVTLTPDDIGKDY